MAIVRMFIMKKGGLRGLYLGPQPVPSFSDNIPNPPFEKEIASLPLKGKIPDKDFLVQDNYTGKKLLVLINFPAKHSMLSSCVLSPL